MTTGSITLAALRRHVVAHQGFATRLRKAGAYEVETAIRRLSGVQLDSISTVERSHRIVLTSRVGNYPRGTVSALLSQGRIFEYWAHEACLLPVEDFPLFRWRMRGRGHWDSHDRALREHPEVAEHVLAEIQARGPLGSRDFEGEGGGGMWNWKPAKRVLDSLWDRGDLSISGRQGFQRLYDLTERVIPRPVLDAPVPSDGDALRGLVLRAVRGRGALTESGIAEHYRVPGRRAAIRPYVDALVAEGQLQRLALARALHQTPADLLAESKAPDEMRYAELGRYIDALKRSGNDANKLVVEQALKIALPATCIIIALFGAPLAVTSPRAGAAVGVAISLGTTVMFLLFVQITKAIGAGGVINPVLATGQIEGGVAQAIGWALYEHIAWREGRMANGQMTNYIMPTSMDLPPIRVAFEERPYPYGPGGAKGIGELPMDGAAPSHGRGSAYI